MFLKIYIIKICIFVSLLVFCFTACDKPESNLVEKYFDLTAEPAISVANGHSEIKITARFNTALKDAIKTVSFSSNAGTFPNGNERGVTKPIIHDTALAVLTAGTKAGTFNIIATVSLDDKMFQEEVFVVLQPITELIELKVDSNNVLADGHQEIILKAQLLDSSLSNVQAIKFNSGSAGVFKGNNSSVIEKGFVDSVATAVLLVGTQPGNYILEATITIADEEFRDTESIHLLPVRDFFNVTLDRTQVLADGNSKVAVTAIFDEQLTPASIQTIAFSSSGGTFMNNNGANTIERPIFNNEATTTLTVGTQVGEYNVQGKVQFNNVTYIQESSLEILPIIPDSIMRLNVTPLGSTIIRADNYSQIEIEVQAINASFEQVVNFETNNGQFLCPNCSNSASQFFNSSGLAKAIFKINNKVENLLIYSTIGNPQLTLDTTLIVLPANPDNISIQSDRLSIPAQGGSVSMKLYLTRGLGRGEVSKGIKVFPMAKQGNLEIGRFSPPILETTDYEPGESNLQLEFKTDIPGQGITIETPITITFTLEKDDGTFLTESIVLSVEE